MEYVTSAEDLREAVAGARAAGCVGVDTETTGLDPRTDRLRLVQVAVPGRVWVVDAWQVGTLAPLGGLLADAGVRKVFHHAAFDLKFFRAAGLREVASVADTMLASQLLSFGLPGGSHTLAAAVSRHLGRDLDKSLGASDFSGALSAAQVLYAARDAAVLLPLWQVLERKLREAGLLRAARLEFGCAPAVADMEYAGILLDLDAWEELGLELRARRDALRGRLAQELVLPGGEDLFGERAPANPNSPQQVKAALEGLGLEVPDTRESTLKAVAGDHPVVRALLECRALEKLISAFIEKLPGHVNPATGRIHATYDQCRTAAGRFSCREPNVQQVPRDPAFRKCFRAEEGNALVICDYSQIELRIAAALSGDARMLDAYRHGQDLHVLTAAMVSGKNPRDVSKEERQRAKACNFGLIYGMSARGLQAYARDSYGVHMSLEEAEEFRRRFFGAYRGITAWHRAQRGLREVRTRSGRLRRFEGDPPATELYNTPVQGTGADVLKRAMGRLRPHLVRLDADLVACVHDELVCECAEERAQELLEVMVREMEAAAAEFVPEVPVVAAARWGGPGRTSPELPRAGRPHDRNRGAGVPQEATAPRQAPRRCGDDHLSRYAVPRPLRAGVAAER
ncbi:MAG: DNA polymerase [Bacillota bacterium]